MSTLKQRLATENFPTGQPKADETRFVQAIGLYPDKPRSFKVVMTRNGRAGIIIEFEPVKKAIANVELLCKALNTGLMSGSTLAFNDVEHQFFLYQVTELDSLDDFLHCLACDCDILMPLCQSIGEQGWWDERVVELAFMVPQEMHRHMQ